MASEEMETATAAEAIPVRPRSRAEEPFKARAERQWLRLRNLWAYGIFVWLSIGLWVSWRTLFLLGYGRMHLSPWVADGFFATEFGQIIGLAALVIKNLFPQGT